jgi:hypothetical protein
VKLDELKEVLNASDHFLISASNLTGEDKPLTEIEIISLEKLINSTYVNLIIIFYSFLFYHILLIGLENEND